MKAFSVIYGILAYLMFNATTLYLVGFVGNFAVPKSVDSGPAVSLAEALIVNLGLVALFALQHSVMARPAFKRAWTRIVPPHLERSTYVILASLTLLFLYWQWRPLPASVWTVTNPIGVAALWAIFGTGWAMASMSTYLINHFELFGLQQVFAKVMGRESQKQPFKTPGFYRYTRHPLYFGFLLAFWATPAMSVGHLLFTLAMTGYILIAIRYEEHDLTGVFGEQYRKYQARVGMIIPFTGGGDTAHASDERAPASGNG
jgi:protein-S-isoprenylcysteine O-methyltransferase Ste14